jgi:hypothetical protein
MRWLVITSGLLLVSSFTCMGEPIHALRFEGLWKLDGPGAVNSKLEFQVTGETFTASFYHPFPSVLSDIHIEGDSFTAWYLDEFGSRVNLTAQLRGSELQLALAPVGRPPRILSGARIAPEPARGTHQTFSGSFSKSDKGASGEFNAGNHTYVFSGGIEGNCVSGSVGKDGKGVAVNGCVAISKTKQ